MTKPEETKSMLSSFSAFNKPDTSMHFIFLNVTLILYLVVNTKVKPAKQPEPEVDYEEDFEVFL